MPRNAAPSESLTGCSIHEHERTSHGESVRRERRVRDASPGMPAHAVLGDDARHDTSTRATRRADGRKSHETASIAAKTTGPHHKATPSPTARCEAAAPV